MSGNTDVTDAEYRQVCRFLFDEADMLSERRYLDWYELVTEDIHYVVPVPQFFEGNTGRQIGISSPYFDDNYASLGVRVDLLSNPATTTAENPPSLFHYFVSNVDARRQDADHLAVKSRVLIYRVSASDPVPYILAGRRTDLLRGNGDGLKLAKREVEISQSIIQSRNLSFLL